MIPAEAQCRVDVWLAARGWTVTSPGRRAVLVGQWLHVCSVFGATSDAAGGVLIGIVREAWGEFGLSTYRLKDGWRVGNGGMYPCLRSPSHEEIDALLAALEAAP